MKLLPRHWPDLPCERRKPGKRRDLFSIEAAEFRQLRDEGSRYHPANARNARQQVFFFAPDRRSAHGAVTIAIDAGQFLFEGLQQARDALFEPFAGALLPLALSADHLDNLPAPRCKVRQHQGFFIGQGAHLRPYRLSKAGNDALK
jgi:hypothetical protein